MHTHSIAPWQHQHAFLGASHERNESRTWLVVLITVLMMVAEIVGGTVYGSMALVADGWHMATHAAALAIAAFAYRFARFHVNDARFSFGTGKLGELAGFGSALILAAVAAFIAYESLMRIFSPVVIRFDEAIVVAAVGLAVNLLCAWLLRDGDQAHGHAHHHHDHHHVGMHEDDHNLRSAYAHVLTDALTSVLAIFGLVMARIYGWVWMDAAVGIVGAIVIAIWALTLMRASGAVLLDMVPNRSMHAEITKRLEVGEDRVGDLHLWRVGPGHTAMIASIVSHDPQTPAAYKARLDGIEGLSHITVEVHACAGDTAASA